MDIRNTFIIALILCFLTPSMIYGQKAAKLKKAQEEYAAGHYNSAAYMLRKAYTSVKKKDEQAAILFKIGECYRQTAVSKQAELWYKKAINKGYQDPVVILYLADAKKMNQKYAEAKEEFIKYKEKVPTDRRGEDGIKSCDLALKWLENGNGYLVENMKFFNSRQADFAPVYASDDYNTVYFTSSREAALGKSVNAVTGESFSDLFVSKLDRKNVWSQPVPVDGEINTEYDEGMCSFSSDFRTMYFTRCKNDKKKVWGCHILSTQLVSGAWSKAKVIDIANDSVVIAHPAISPDDLTLFFVSDMPGGQGGKDIWKVTRKSAGDDWSMPKNLGPEINTQGDEMFPYMHSDGTFYFSSNGHIGMGGLDIFKADNNEGHWVVENMGYPINSYADDFGITFQNDNEQGFFSSNRTMRGDDDIFVFTLPPLSFSLAGLVVDEKTNKALGGGSVKIISSDGITNEMPVGIDGTFKTGMKPNTDYVFIASRKGYLNGKERETTKGLDKSKEFKITIPLASIENPIELTNIFYDYAKWDLRPESMVALDKLVEVLIDNPNITIELGSHTDSRGSAEDNQLLSQRRAQSVVNYLIEKGIAADRLTPKGYGEALPKVVDEPMVKQYPFLRRGTKLTEEYINSLRNQTDQENAHQQNRRSEFRVLRTDYEEK
ncbi:MAG: OmpA family protein [Bacteroidales bacterium]|jgi:peptidoglycan-associated lipoprotein|nr:OmpA family protein [Bacteroidales bacterium]